MKPTPHIPTLPSGRNAALSLLAGTRLHYLATPYSKYPLGIERAFMDAAALAAQLLRVGVRVYSPIAHTHPLAIYGHIDPFDHAIWLPFDEAMMMKCDALIVAHMEGWEESKGIAHEIEFFRVAEKAIWDLDPATLLMRKRKPDDDRNASFPKGARA